MTTTTLTSSTTSRATGRTCSVRGAALVLDELTRDEVTAALYASSFEPGDLDRRGLDTCESFVRQALIEIGHEGLAHDATVVAVANGLDADTLAASGYPDHAIDFDRLNACRDAANVIVEVRP